MQKRMCRQRHSLRRRARPRAAGQGHRPMTAGPSGPRRRDALAFGPERSALPLFSERRGSWVMSDDRAESPRIRHHAKPLDVALHVAPSGSALLREEAQVGSAVSARLAVSGSREGGWSGCTPPTVRAGLPARRASVRSWEHDTVRSHGALRRSAARRLGVVPCRRASTGRWNEQTLNWQSPREHRAPFRQKCRKDATDFTADQGPEVERPGTEVEPSTHRMRGARGRRTERQATARGNRLRWPGPDGRQTLRELRRTRFTEGVEATGVRPEGMDDAAQLL